MRFVLVLHTVIRNSADTRIAFEKLTIMPLIIKFSADVHQYKFRVFGGGQKIHTC